MTIPSPLSGACHREQKNDAMALAIKRRFILVNYNLDTI